MPDNPINYAQIAIDFFKNQRQKYRRHEKNRRHYANCLFP